MAQSSDAPDGSASRCIDENTAARLLGGTLSLEDKRSIERHLDGCKRCSELLTELARIYYSKAPVAGAATERVVPAHAAGTLASRVPELGPGAEVSRYRIERKLAAGGMGMVYVALDPALGRRVALEVLRPELETNDCANEAVTRLLREAHAMARLSQPHVVPVYDVGTHEGRPFIAMELVDGVTLRDWLREAPRSFPEILGVFRQAGEGLAAAHAAGLVHRDFKPENVLVTRDGVAKVSDFGLTRLDLPLLPPTNPYRAPKAEPDPPEPLTRTGAVMGTPAYMAPEQLFGQIVDARSDQFAFAASLYEALYGTRPFAAATLEELRWRLASGRFAAPTRDVGAPRWIRPVLERALSVDPARRYGTMTALLGALSGEAERAPRRHVVANMVVQGTLLAAHLFISGIFVVGMLGPGSPTTDTASAGPSSVDGPIMNGIAALMAMSAISILGWAPMGLAWVPVNLWGLSKRRSWARWSSLLYALFCLPTCLGTPYALYGIWSLTRPSVKQYFESE